MWLLTSLVASSSALTLETSDRTLTKALPGIVEAGVACTGREIAIAEPLVVDRVQKLAGSTGVEVLYDESGALSRIDVTGGTRNEVVAAVVAGAWFERDVLGVWVGRSQLLAGCIADATGTTPGWTAGDLSEMPDLRLWTAFDAQFTARQQEGASRLFEAIGLVLGDEVVFEPGFTTWEAVDAALAGAGERGRAVLDAMASVEGQRLALDDPDNDGWSRLYEELTGTDPELWDSDGDGWWDGAPERPEGAVLVPRDGSLICAPKVPAGEEHMTLEYGGRLLGFPLHDRVEHGVGISEPIRISFDWANRPGGAWFVVRGDELVDNPACRMSEGLTIRDATERFPKLLKAIEPHLIQALSQLEAIAGPSPRRQVVQLGDSGGSIVRIDAVPEGRGADVPGVLVPVAIGNEARKKERLDHVAAQAAALLRFADIEALFDPAAAGAFGCLMTGRPVPNTPQVSSTRAEVKAWIKRVERCGWDGIVEGCE